MHAKQRPVRSFLRELVHPASKPGTYYLRLSPVSLSSQYLFFNDSRIRHGQKVVAIVHVDTFVELEILVKVGSVSSPSLQPQRVCTSVDRKLAQWDWTFVEPKLAAGVNHVDVDVRVTRPKARFL